MPVEIDISSASVRFAFRSGKRGTDEEDLERYSEDGWGPPSGSHVSGDGETAAPILSALHQEAGFFTRRSKVPVERFVNVVLQGQAGQLAR